MGNLSIFNSKKLLIIILVAVFVISFCIEYNYRYLPKNFYIQKDNDYYQNTDKKSFIIGDSRAACDINPDVLGNFLSLAEDGGTIIKHLDVLLNSNKEIDTIIIAVSPASLFGSFTQNYLNRRKITSSASNSIRTKIKKTLGIFKRPSKNIERQIMSKIREYSISPYGIDILKFTLSGYLEEYNTSNGWNPINRLYGNQTYTTWVNDYAYSSKVLETYNDSILIRNIKIEFEKLLKKTECTLFLIRLPVGDNIVSYEEEKFPWFNNYINSILSGNINYIHIENFDYSFERADGSHMSEYQALKCSFLIKEKIKNYEKY